MDKADRIWELMGKVLHEEATSTEIRELEEWRKLSDSNEQIWKETISVWQKAGMLFEHQKHNSSQKWNDLLQTLASRKRRRIFAQISIAASLLILFTLGSILVIPKFLNKGLMAQEFVEDVPCDSVIQNLSLPDGTLVSLNSEAHFSYPKTFNGNTREVKLSGEAFFNVTPNREKPFIIKIGSSQIKVLGTSFNVKAHPDKDTIEVIVATGRVELSCNSVKPIVLSKGEKGTLDLVKKNIVKEVNKDRNYSSWNSKLLVFRNSKMSEVVKKLSDTYHVHILFDSKQLKDIEWTVTFDNQSLAAVFNIMERTFDINVTYENNIYWLKKRK